MPSPSPRRRPQSARPRGFTLIELAIVAAILGVLTALSVAGWQRMRESSALQNASNDFSAALSKARSRAFERRTDVWVVVYPNRMRNGATTTTGSYFLIDDTTGTFGAGGYTAFDPPLAMPVAPAKLLFAGYLEDYSRSRNAKFIVGSTAAPLIPSFPATSPFAALNTGANSLTSGTACNFCTGAGVTARGAIIFTGDGTARFVDAVGNPATLGTTATAAARAGFVSISEANTLQNHRRGYVFAVSKPTAFVALYSSP
ncbi:MAG TPA: prepilin-type N-terminal cleavage/methylation domain-containing protein [Myxococcales bacterium]|nr:prepilin-type N-terminal cleavage/methylation domain-containing protein [Myxococcales bacterium]